MTLDYVRTGLPCLLFFDCLSSSDMLDVSAGATEPTTPPEPCCLQGICHVHWRIKNCNTHCSQMWPVPLSPHSSISSGIPIITEILFKSLRLWLNVSFTAYWDVIKCISNVLLNYSMHILYTTVCHCYKWIGSGWGELLYAWLNSLGYSVYLHF